MRHQFWPSVRALLALTVLTGFAYPLAMTGVSKALFPAQSEGSLVIRNGQAVGSSLIAQKTENAALFWPRPSASDYGAVPSGASNLSPASVGFKEAVDMRKAVVGESAPADLLTASGSGLDPHISPEAAHYQLSRIKSARHLDEGQVKEVDQMITELTEAPLFGIWGQPRVNVLQLNLRLMERFSSKL